MEQSHDNQLNLSFIIIVGSIVIIGIISIIFWILNIQTTTDDVSVRLDSGNTSGPAAFGRSRLTPTPTTDPVAATAQAEVDQIAAAINAGGCIACHTIPEIPGAVGQIGPDLSNIGVDGATRVAGYSAEEYILESIMDPEAFIAPDCPTGPCPSGVMIVPELETGQIETIVGYLSTLGNGE